MKTLEVTEKTEVRRILETFAELDRIRWSDKTNYDLINYCARDLTPDERILTHWLCYLTDRQMPFQRIWDVGGYVLSHIVRSYSRDGWDAAELEPRFVRPSQEHSFVLECPLGESGNRRLQRHGEDRNPVRFASRYVPEDLLLIFRTLAMLARTSKRSLASFVRLAIGKVQDHTVAIQRIAAALNELTYKASGAVSARPGISAKSTFG